MIQRSSLSVRGLYNWDNTLFDNMVLPENVEKDIVVSNILSELGEFEVLYPDSDYMKEIIGYWSRKQLPTWTKWNSELSIEYDPIYNYKKYTVYSGTKSNTNTRSDTTNETVTNTLSSTDTTNNSVSGTETLTKGKTGNESLSKETSESINGNIEKESTSTKTISNTGTESTSTETDKTNDTTENVDETITEKVKAYNESVNFVDYKQNVTDRGTVTDNDVHEETTGTKNTTENGTETNAKTDEETETRTTTGEASETKTTSETTNESKEKSEEGEETKVKNSQITESGETTGSRQDVSSGENAYTRSVTGNTGFSSYQKLLEEEINLREKYNIYNLIIRDFKLRFCLLLY